MTDTIARLRSGKMIFETMVDLDNAMKLRRGENISLAEVVRDVAVYTDQRKGMRAGSAELMNIFGTTDLFAVVEQIVKKGNIEVTQEYRNEKLDAKRKQVADFLAKNAVDARTGRPFTPDIIQSALKEAGVNIQDKPLEKQLGEIVEKVKKIIPLKIETKKIKIKIPSVHTGKVYGLLQDYKEKEDWLQNGELEVILNIPVGILLEFYDKLNAVTHGSALTEEMK
ncbi:MAG: ribosome assembly factor SBDS [Nanoarchaeota archaeon]